jgi:hypothetical protein
MKKIGGKQLTQEIEKVCREDLNKIEKNGIPHQHLVHIAATAAEGHWNYFSKENWKAVRNTAREYRALAKLAENFSQRIDNLRNRGLAVEELPKSLRAQAWGSRSNDIGQRLRRNGGKNHDPAIPIVAIQILTRKQQFDCWKELSRVLRVAYIATGRKDADHIKADSLHTALLRAAKPYREKVKA